MKQDSQPVICCPTRLYASDFETIQHVAEVCFGEASRLIANIGDAEADRPNVLAFGKGLAGELGIPKPGKTRGNFSIDWILAHVSSGGKTLGIAAAEVQTVDTNGSYGPLVEELIAGRIPKQRYVDSWARAGVNWENVNKRILPQLIYKGHALRRESKNLHGLFFVCPKPVYERLIDRLGEDLMRYELQPGALTFSTYDLGPVLPDGQIRQLVFQGMSTTTVDQAALAFTSPRNLPEANSYLRAINQRLAK